MIHTILTHPGGAHKDEFLACSLMLALHPVPIQRREPEAADLSDPAVCVLDAGQEHDPSRHNFDHHQLPRDHAPVCTLSLVLQHLGLYEDARGFCEWLEPLEWFDCRGPNATAEWLGVNREALNRLVSPMDLSLLRKFAQTTRLEPGEPLWEMMRMIGTDLIDYLKSLRTRLDFIATHASIWDIALADGMAQVLFLPRTDPLPDEPSLGLERFVESRGLAETVIGMVYPDRRGTGYGMSRFRDNPRLDFTRIANHPDVHFAHARGFVAKTSAAERETLRALLLEAGRSEP